MSTITLVVGLLITLAVVAAFAGIYVIVERPSDVRDRLENYDLLERRRLAQREAERRKSLTPLARMLDSLFHGRALTERLATRLAQADLKLTVTEFITLLLALVIVSALLGYLLQRQLASAIGAAALAFFLPWFWLEQRRQKRIKLFHDQLIDVLVLLVGSLRSGHGLLNALELVSKELNPPASQEFGRVVQEVGFGISQPVALDHLLQRMESSDLQLMVTAINISHEAGGNLSTVLEQIAETLRERIQLHGEIRVLTTQQRLTSYLLLVMPFFLGTAMAILSPAYIMRMFQPQWIFIPIAAIISELIGYFITRRVVRIEV